MLTSTRTLYGFINGLFGSGIWVLAHECGHHAFSTSKVFDDALGLILHSLLLVPYFSWRVSHRNHHKAIGNMATDTSFVPVTRLSYAQRFGKTIESIAEYSEDSPIYTFFYLLFHQLIDWPMYMLIMIGMGEKWFEKQLRMGRAEEKRKTDGTLVRTYPLSCSHYWPFSPIYEPRDVKFILITDIALMVSLSVLYSIGNTYGWWNLAVWYGVPYLWTNHWLGKL
jgi:omega-6 fatty acid desaturase (delta-12 desaturase)